MKSEALHAHGLDAECDLDVLRGHAEGAPGRGRLRIGVEHPVEGGAHRGISRIPVGACQPPNGRIMTSADTGPQLPAS